MTDQEDKVRWEQNFRDIFTKINKLIPFSTFTITITVLIGFWGSMFGLMYNDIQNHKEIANKQRIEVIRELGEVKVLIGQIKR